MVGSNAGRVSGRLLVALVLAVLAGGTAWATIPDSDGVIHACYSNATGALRVIDTDLGQTCRSGETALDWNQQGPPGEPGGLSDLHHGSGAVSVGSSAYTDVVTLTLPAGAYHATGKAVAQNQTIGPAVIACNVRAGAISLDTSDETVPAPSGAPSYATMAFDAAIALAGAATVRLECINAVLNPDPIRVTGDLAATTVGSIEGQA